MPLVLNYGPKSAYEHERAERVYMIWPCAAWRIVAPLPSDRRINIFQKAVLGLCRTGSYPISEIATTLHLHPRLIEAIGLELRGFGWVDPETWRPTPKGLAMLNEDELAMDSLVTGWVFQDPRSGELWPFFSRQLQLQDTAPCSEPTRLSLLLGPPAKPRKTFAWQLESQASPGRPSSEAVLTAIRRFRRREKLKGFMRLAASGLDESSSGGSPEMLSRISFISEKPEPVGLVTFGHLPSGGGLRPQICDPFGFGCADEMWRQLGRAAQQDDGAFAAHRELLRLAQAKDAPALEEQLAWQRQGAESEVIKVLSLDIRDYPAIYQHLVDATHNVWLAETVGGNPQGQLASVMAFCRKTLEALLKEVARRSPLTDAHKMLNGDVAKDRATIDAIASAFGFRCPLPSQLQIDKRRGRPNKGLIERICGDIGQIFSLPSGVIATLLAASKDVVHPFKSAAVRDPELLEKIATIIDLGNAGSHDDSHNPTPKQFSIVEAGLMRELSLKVVGCLLNLSISER